MKKSQHNIKVKNTTAGTFLKLFSTSYHPTAGLPEDLKNCTCIIISFNTYNNPANRNYYPHSMNEKTEVQ